MLSLHIQSLDLAVSHDLWIVLVTGLCAAVIAFSKRRRR